MISSGALRFALWAVTLLIVMAALVAGIRSHRRARASEYRSYASPDGRFRFVVYRISSTFAMPGQSSDAPGFVRLYDLRSGRILQEKDVEMVQLIDQFEWSSTNLYIKLFADWKLPD
jgi:hypothetical protein